MRTFHLILFFLCSVELYAQRTRTVTNQAASTEEPRPVRTRGRSRFTATEELAQVSEQPERTTSNRRASARTRINSNTPKVAADRRARPIEISTRGYAVEEINNDSPIDSFIRQSRPRVLSENQFEASTAGRRPNTYEASTPAPADLLPVDELGFGSTARAILQARGEPLPAKTTTPVVDEEYLLTNFGNTIRTLAGSPPAARSFSRNDIPIQRPTPLRSEVPILDQEDIPVRRTSLRADPLPSLKNSEINFERELPARTRNGGGRGRVAEGRANPRVESGRRPPTTTSTTTERQVVEEYVRFNPETDAPEVVQGLELETATETQSFVEIPIEDELPDEEDVRKSTVVEIFTPRSTYSPPTTEAPVTSRRNGGRSRFIAEPSVTTAAPRSRGVRTRATRRPEESNTSSNTRTRISRRRFDDADVAESRHRGPSVFTAEQYQDVTSRSRSGRKIDSRFEAVPTRAAETPTVRSRNSGRRATTVGSTTTERSRERARSRSEPTSPPTTRPSRRRASLVENNVFPAAARRLNPQEELVPKRTAFVETSRSSNRRTNLEDTKASRKANNIEEAILNVERGTGSRSSNRRGSHVDTPSRNRVGPSRFEPVDVGNSRAQNDQPASKTRSSSNRNGPTRQPEVVEETTIYYGEKSRKTDAPPEITTVFSTEKPILKNNIRSRSRFPDTPPRLDESKLEVLPLFERETKATNSVRFRGSRSRSGLNKRHGVDHMDASATENDVKFVEKPTTSAFTRVTVSRTESFEASTSRSRLSTRVASSSTTEVPNKRSLSTRAPVTTTTTAPETTTRKITRAPPIIKESVVAEFNQVTSKSTITRRKKVSKAKATEIGSRGNKKAEVKLLDGQKKKTSDEDIGEEDNYPEPFKALIQAKKLKDDSKPSPRTTVAPIVQNSTPRVIVTSASVPRGSSTARLVTTTVAPRKLQELNELISDNDNELDPRPRISSVTSTTTLRPTRSRQLPKFSEKPKQKFEKTKFSPSKPTSTPRKSYSTKSYSTKSSAAHHPRRKALRSTAVPPPTTPLSVINREAKFSAKFIKKENNGKAFGGQLPKGLYSSKKNNENDSSEEEIGSKLDVSLIQSANPVQPIKKFNASRYSSRYRSDISTRSSVIKPTTSAPFYIPTIPTPAYVPTVPTVTPPVAPVDGIVAVSDADLGVEVISFDDPSNSISSADLVNGEYLTTDKNLKLSPTVKDGTTEKPVSIIERIINSITLISTTEAPNTTLNNLPSPTTTQASGNSAILKLAAKKLTTKDKTDVQTNIIETITSEKPTTIIEKIRSSLSAIQTNEVDSNRMARLLSTEQRNTDLPRIIISSTTVGSISSSSTSTTGKSTVSSTSLITSTPPSSTTTSGTTLITSTFPPITPTSSTTEAPKRVEIIAVPGETRISKSQTTTTPSPESTSDSTTNVPSSTLEIGTDQIFSSTETIPTNLGDILNGRTVDALNNLINPDPSSTKLPNYKNLQLNQNSITSNLPSTVTIAQSTLSDAPFTSPMFSTERATFFPSSSDTLLSSTLISTLMPVSSTSIPTTQSTTTTIEPKTTTLATTTTRRPETTTIRLTTTARPKTTTGFPTTARPKTTTGFPTFAPSTILPTILTTLFPNLLRGAITTPISPISSTRKPLIGAELGNNIADGFEVLSVAGSTARPTTVLPQTSTSQRISTSTTPITTTTQSTTTITTTTTTTTTPKPTITTTKRKTTTNKPKTSESGTPTPSTKEETDKLFDELKKSGKLKNLNEEQRKNLEEIERIEKEQAELLKQLSLLTTMFGGPNGRQPNLPISGNPVGGSSNSLANRIINMAIERDKSRPTTDSPPETSTTKKITKATTKRPNSIQDQLPITQLDDTTKRVTPSLEDVLKQYNLNGLSTELPLTSTYGKTDEAVLAAILKEHGIGPTTPKVLGDKVKEAGLFDESTTTTKKPKPKPKPKSATTTTIRPPLGGRLMQGLNWLLDILDPPTTTKKPAPRRAKPKTPKPAAAEEELLTNQPTRITPMITAAPVTKPNLSQEEIKGLIKQLEEARKNPNAIDQLDLTKIRSLQNLINVNEGVEVTHTGQHGATSRATPRPRKTKSTTVKDPFLTQVNQKPVASTISTVSVSNSIDDDVELISTTTRNRVMPPVSLNPIPGIDDNTGDSVIRGNLLTAAVNVTKAISSFLGSAIQDAGKQVRSMFYNGSSGVFSGLSSGSSIPSSIARASG
ncbi:unnamed protein product [Ceutorhynchus assimilis]|uniref:Uncharacterized protein n=1 Tax=Ceutorhynchus assimilis TaxID=467358 RepID=A0A9P0GP67_9CUCU|nr:unnamed protein product [Ceutorhynchus assimilis]